MLTSSRSNIAYSTLATAIRWVYSAKALLRVVADTPSCLKRAAIEITEHIERSGGYQLILSKWE